MVTFGFGPDTDRLSALYRYGILDRPSDPVFNAITQDVSKALGGMTVQMVLVDDHRLWIASTAGTVLEDSPKQGSMSAAVIEQTEALVIEDAARDARFATSQGVLDTPRLRAFAGVCLRTPDNHAIGALCTADTKPRAFRPAHVALLTRAKNRLMDALEARLDGRLDPATGAMAATAFCEQVAPLAELAARHKRDLSLLVIEIDPFRTLLESLKTDLGRLVVERIGGLGRNNVRRLDTFGRLSGSQFAMLLPDTGATGAARLASRLVEGLAEGWAFPAPAGQEPTPIGVGVATLRAGFDSADDLIARALEGCSLSRAAAAGSLATPRGAKVA